MTNIRLESLIQGEATALPEVAAGPRLLKQLGYVIESNGSWLRAEARGIAIVLTVTGRVDATNVHVVGGHLARFIGLRGPLIVVMKATTEGRCGQVLLDAFDDQCRHACVAWVLVGRSDAVTAQLPLAGSVAAASRRLFDESLRGGGQLVENEDVATVTRLRTGSPSGQ